MFVPYGGFNGKLDKLGLASGAKLIFSPLQLLTKAGYDAVMSGTVSGMVQIRRTSDYTAQWIGCKGDGSLDLAAAYAFIGSSNGLIRDCLNEGNLSDTYSFKQLTTANEPKLFDTGALLEDGPLFDGNDDFISVADYSGIDITTPPLSIYANFKVTDTDTQYILSRNTDALTNMQYGLQNSATSISQVLENNYKGVIASNVGSFEKVLSGWFGTGSNEAYVKDESNSNNDTQSGSLTSRAYTYIGCRRHSTPSETGQMKGNLKHLIIFNTDVSARYNDLIREIA